MSATDELRKLLDERGVGYSDGDVVVYFEDERGYKVSAYDAPRRYGDCILCVSHTATPEQAIAATLGAGMCHIVKASRRYVLSDGTELFENGCSVCNGYLGDDDNFCPNCGRRVEG